MAPFRTPSLKDQLTCGFLFSTYSGNLLPYFKSEEIYEAGKMLWAPLPPRGLAPSLLSSLDGGFSLRLRVLPTLRSWSNIYWKHWSSESINLPWDSQARTRPTKYHGTSHISFPNRCSITCSWCSRKPKNNLGHNTKYSTALRKGHSILFLHSKSLMQTGIITKYSTATGTN